MYDHEPSPGTKSIRTSAGPLDSQLNWMFAIRGPSQPSAAERTRWRSAALPALNRILIVLPLCQRYWLSRAALRPSSNRCASSGSASGVMHMQNRDSLVVSALDPGSRVATPVMTDPPCGDLAES